MNETVIGFDFGGTWLKAAEVGRDGNILWSDRVSSEHDFPRDMENVAHLVSQRTEGVVAATVASAGPLDLHTGEVKKAFNLNWIDVFPGRELERVLGVPVLIENDADCAALAEEMYGSGKGAELLVYMGLGTGVGAGIVERGRIFHGAGDPEFGHQIVDPASDRTCLAGHRGCLEAFVSGGALERHFGSIESVPVAEWEETIPRFLGVAMVNAILFLAPDVIVLGGGVIDHRADIVDPAREHMRRTLNAFVPEPRVEVSKLGKDIGVLGAAASAWQLHESQTSSG